MEMAEVLSRSELFHTLNDEEFREVERLCRRHEFEAGTIIFRQDKEAEDIYIVESGLVSLLLELSPMDMRQIQAVSDYECFGWSAIVPPYQRSCTAKAVEKTKVLAFNGKDLRYLFFTNPMLCANITSGVAYVLSQRLRATYNQLMGVTYQI